MDLVNTAINRSCYFYVLSTQQFTKKLLRPCVLIATLDMRRLSSGLHGKSVLFSFAKLSEHIFNNMLKKL